MTICITIASTLLLTALAGAVSSKHYHIVPVDSTALCQHYPNGTCFTLDQLSSQISDTGDVTIIFLPGEHLLTWNMTFVNRTNITLSNEQLQNSFKNAPRISLRCNTQISVKTTDIFTLQGLVIQDSQRQYDSLSEFLSQGGGAVNLVKTVAIIKYCVFKNNSAKCKSFCGGGAIYLENTTAMINNSTFENNSVSCEHCSGGALYSKFSKIKIDSCVFSDNIAYAGGGAFIFMGRVHIMRSTLEKNMAYFGGAIWNFGSDTIHMAHSIFQQNVAVFGGGAVITFNRIIIERTIYKNNTAARGAGGALFVISDQMVNITKSVFEYNKAIIGGAAAAWKKGAVTITNSVFSSNQAFIGGAISLERSELQSGNILITSNSAKFIAGGVYAVQSTIHLKNAMIHGNVALQDGGGIYLTASSASIDNSFIESNTAQHYGGGIYIQDRAQLLLINNQLNIIVLENNTAKRGGAMYVSDSGSGQVHCDKVTYISKLSTFKECFIQSTIAFGKVPEQYINLYFINNSAQETGSDIYGGLLDRCVTSKYFITDTELGINFIKKRTLYSWAEKVENISQFYKHVSSDPVKVCFCWNDIIDCKNSHPTVFKRKGETFTLSVVAVDQVGKPVNATLTSLLPSKRYERLKEGQQHRPVGDYCTELEYNVYSLEPSSMLQIYADGPCGNQGISKQELNITFEPCTCPIGLEKTQDPLDCSCDCAPELKQYISSCSPENETIQINGNVWIEYINLTNSTSKFVTHPCPVGYCVAKPVNISLVNQTEADQQCAFNRIGRLCGQCAQGLSLVFASRRCQHCTNYYLFLLLLFGLAGIALVAFILLLNITVATGTIHGLIFYANILVANRSVFIPFNNNNFLTVFISWLNFDLGIETCFYNGMDSYGKFLLQLVFPVYVFLLIVIIIVLCNHSQRIANLFGKKNPEATLYTLILLSYSKLIRLIITALQNAHIDYPDGQKIFWLYDANVPYFTPSHIPRFLAAFIITIFGAVYITLLLCGQLLNHCSEHRLMKWTTHKYYIHFLKAHHAPLSDKHRYWVGLLLLARLVHYLISAFTDNSTAILSVSALATLLLLHKTNNQIYKNWLLNTLETIFIVNLSILAVASMYIGNSAQNHCKQEARGNQQALATVSMSVSFIAFLGMVFYHILDCCRVKLGELPKTIMKVLREHQNKQLFVAIKEEETDTYELYDQDDNDQLREPALDDLIPVQPEDYNRLPTPPPERKEPIFTEIDIRAAQSISM